MGEFSFSSKIGEAGEIVKEGLLLINPRYIEEQQVLMSIYTNFWEEVLSKI